MVRDASLDPSGLDLALCQLVKIIWPLAPLAQNYHLSTNPIIIKFNTTRTYMDLLKKLDPKKNIKYWSRLVQYFRQHQPSTSSVQHETLRDEFEEDSSDEDL